MAKKVRNHNEWFTPVSLGGRKSCPLCKERLPHGEVIWSWGEYHNGRWNTVKHFCCQCFRKQVLSELLRHKDSCGCEITLVGKYSNLPAWLTLETSSECAACNGTGKVDKGPSKPTALRFFRCKACDGIGRLSVPQSDELNNTAAVLE